jgi:hypothetical protein
MIDSSSTTEGDDGDVLSKLTESALCITQTQEITNCNDRNFLLPAKLHGRGSFYRNQMSPHPMNDHDGDDDDTTMVTQLPQIDTITILTIHGSSNSSSNKNNNKNNNSGFGVPGFPDFHWNDTTKTASDDYPRRRETTATAIDWEDQRRRDLILAAATNTTCFDNDDDDVYDGTIGRSNANTRTYHQKQLRKLRILRVRRQHKYQQSLLRRRCRRLRRGLVNDHHATSTGLVRHRRRSDPGLAPPQPQSNDDTEGYGHHGNNNDDEYGGGPNNNNDDYDDDDNACTVIGWKRERTGVANDTTRRFSRQQVGKRNYHKKERRKVRGWRSLYELRFDQARSGGGGRSTMATTIQDNVNRTINTSKLGLEFHQQQKQEQRVMLDLQVGMSHLKML